MSEITATGQLISTFSDVNWPRHLSLDIAGQVLVADCSNDRILLLNDELQLQCVLVDRNCEVTLWKPWRLYYNHLTGQLYVVHGSNQWSSSPDVISLLSLH